MNTLYLAWRRLDHRWWPVGRLSREGSDYVFTYTQGARSAEGAGFRPLSSFPDFDQVYVSTQLFPMFQNRLPPPSRPDYDDFIEWLDLDRGEADPLVMLARSGGQRETDMFEVFPIPERSAEGRYRSTFFVHGLRHRGPSAEEEVRRLRPGDALALEAEPGNPHDPRALRIHTVVRGVHIGFVPRYLCQDVHALLSTAGEQAQVRVQRVNPPPTPSQFRVLCFLDSPWPQGFRPLANPRLRTTALIRPRRARVGSRVARAGSIRAMTVQWVCPLRADLMTCSPEVWTNVHYVCQNGRLNGSFRVTPCRRVSSELVEQSQQVVDELT